MSQILTLTPQSQPLHTINNHQSLITQPPPPFSDVHGGFPMVAIAVLGIGATAFLLVSYYIFVSKCDFRWQNMDPLRRFSMRRARTNDEPLTSYSPSWQSRGLDEVLIRELPVFEYNKNEGQSNTFSKCVVCLNEFQDHDLLRVLPKCSHAFHLDCIDVWLQNNSNCPLCRSTISGRNRYRFERIVAPTSSPQDPQPMTGSIVGEDEHFVVIEITGEDRTGFLEQEGFGSSRFLIQPRSHSSRKFEFWRSKPRKFRHHVSIMGDERIDVRERDDQFSVQPIRRSFSMDSAVDRHAYLSMQEFLRQDRRQISEDNGNRSRNSIFSFGNGRGSRNAVLPVEF